MTALGVLALLCWLYLLAGHGDFWQSGPELEPATAPVARPAAPAPAVAAPAVAIVVPARDEAAAIGASLGSLLKQDYAGDVRIVLVDDSSRDGTGAIADALIRAHVADPPHPDQPARRAAVLAGAPRPSGWSGKLWAVSQGVAVAGQAPDYLLLTDADIVHDPRHLATLVAKAERDRLDMVSEMVRLNCDSRAERWLVPAFVYFFQLLYPFLIVNDPLRIAAAAAGGSILIRRPALERIGGIAAVRGALIDDVALATAVKRGGPIWLGHTRLATSIRRYQDAREIWRMIARTAFVQLRHSWVLLALCLLGLGVAFVLPPMLALFGHGQTRLLGTVAWLLMAVTFLPTLRRYGRPAWSALALPAIAGFYMAATLGSALDHARGRGTVWKGRAYQDAAA